jgi:hypothetical protein
MCSSFEYECFNHNRNCHYQQPSSKRLEILSFHSSTLPIPHQDWTLHCTGFVLGVSACCVFMFASVYFCGCVCIYLWVGLPEKDFISNKLHITNSNVTLSCMSTNSNTRNTKTHVMHSHTQTRDPQTSHTLTNTHTHTHSRTLTPLSTHSHHTSDSKLSHAHSYTTHVILLYRRHIQIHTHESQTHAHYLHTSKNHTSHTLTNHTKVDSPHKKKNKEQSVCGRSKYVQWMCTGRGIRSTVKRKKRPLLLIAIMVVCKIVRVSASVWVAVSGFVSEEWYRVGA